MKKAFFLLLNISLLFGSSFHYNFQKACIESDNNHKKCEKAYDFVSSNPDMKKIINIKGEPTEIVTSKKFSIEGIDGFYLGKIEGLQNGEVLGVLLNDLVSSDVKYRGNYIILKMAGPAKMDDMDFKIFPSVLGMINYCKNDKYCSKRISPYKKEKVVKAFKSILKVKENNSTIETGLIECKDGIYGLYIKTDTQIKNSCGEN